MGATLEQVAAAVFPVFGLVVCGVLAGRFGLVTQASSAALNQFVYAFALPAMLFVAVYRGSLEDILSGSFMFGVIAATLGTAVLGYAVSRYAQKDAAPESTLRALNASFANTGYLGIPLVTIAYGERAALPAALATVATNFVSFALAIVLLELFVNPHPDGLDCDPRPGGGRCPPPNQRARPGPRGCSIPTRPTHGSCSRLDSPATGPMDLPCRRFDR